jgi:2-methylcitrate dehydratase PrpD
VIPSIAASTTATGPTSVLARFAAELSWADIPDKVQQRVKDILVDALASAMVGHGADDTSTVIGFARDLGGAGDSTVIGGQPLAMTGATIANGFLITAQMLCDVHRPTLCHVTPEVVAPSLVMAERCDASGAELLTSIAIGLEICTRVGVGMNYVPFRRRGWHSPGITGTLGAAAAVGRLLGLNPAQMSNALSLAGSQAGGTFAQLGSPALKFQQARGALSGLMAGLLAARGLRAAPEILTHPDGGLYSAFSDGGDPDAAIEDLGGTWELENISLRAWPVGVHLLNPIACLFALLDTHQVSPDDIARIEVRLGPAGSRTHAEKAWQDTFRARMSLHWAMAVVLHDRACWLEQFSPERLTDRAVSEFADQRVILVEDPALAGAAACVALETVDGHVHSMTREFPPGDAATPFTHEEVVEKLLVAGRSFGLPEELGRIDADVATMEEAGHVRPFIRRLGRPGPPERSDHE